MPEPRSSPAGAMFLNVMWMERVGSGPEEYATFWARSTQESNAAQVWHLWEVLTAPFPATPGQLYLSTNDWKPLGNCLRVFTDLYGPPPATPPDQVAWSPAYYLEMRNVPPRPRSLVRARAGAGRVGWWGRGGA